MVAQFVRSAALLFSDAAVVGVAALLPVQDRHGVFRNTGFAQGQAYDLIQGYDAAASWIVDHVADWPSFHSRWGGCTAASCATTFIRTFGEAAFRRPLTDTEVQAFQPILDAAVAATLSYNDTVKLLGRAFLQSPEFLYLFEDSLLTDYQLASRLSYFLTNGPPDQALYATAKAQTLHQPAVLGAQIDRLLAGDLTPFAREFALDYLDLSRATTRNVTTDPTVIAQFVSSAVETFASLVQNDQPIGSILTTESFASNSATAMWITGQPSSSATTLSPTASYPFMGLLTHPATLISMSNAVFGSTVSRGIFVADQMLCLPPTPPPPQAFQPGDVAGVLPANPTQRDYGEARMADPRCGICHKQFESFSFGLNKWGGDGLFKTDPALKDDGPVLTALGTIQFGSYKDYLPQLAGSAQFEHCVTDQLLRYGLQHTQYPPDLAVAVLTAAKTNASKVTFRALIKALTTQAIFTTK